MSRACIRLLGSPESAAATALLDAAVNVIDTYLTSGEENSVFEEPAFKNTFNGDLNGYPKADQMGRNDDSSPRLRILLAVTKMAMGQAFGGNPSVHSLLRESLQNLS